MTQPSLKANDSEIVKALLETNKQLTDQIIELTRLIVGVQHPVYPVPMEASTDPLMMPESEEDANYLLKTGQIDKSHYEDILKELKFYSSEIIVPT